MFPANGGGGGGGGTVIDYVPLTWDDDSDAGTAEVNLVIGGKAIMEQTEDGTGNGKQFVQNNNQWVEIEPLTPASTLSLADILIKGTTTEVFPAPIDFDSWHVVGTIDGIDIYGNGGDTDPLNSDKFGFEFQPEVPVYDFSLLGANHPTGSITQIASKAPVEGTYVWFGEGPDAAMTKITLKPVKQEAGEAYFIYDSEKSEIVVEEADLNQNTVPPLTLKDFADKINTLHQYGGTEGHLLGQSQDVLLIDAQGGNPIDAFASISPYPATWWVRDGGEFQPFYTPETFSYSALGLAEGDFDGYLQFHVVGANNETKQGFFTESNPFFTDLQTVLSDRGEGDFVKVNHDPLGTSVSGTDSIDVYQVGNYHVNSTPGSDFFVLGMGSSGQNTHGLYQNENYINGAVDAQGSNYNADMDAIYVSWLPEGVVVDANFGKVSHGSGGPGSTADDVRTDYFAGIEAFDLTQYDDYFAGGGEVDINWIDPGAGNDQIHGVDSVFTVLDYSSISNEFGVYFYNEDYSMPVFNLVTDQLGTATHNGGLYTIVVNTDSGYVLQELNYDSDNDRYTEVGQQIDISTTDTSVGQALLDGTTQHGFYTPPSVTLPGTTSTVTVENGDYFHGLVYLDTGDVDVYRFVDYFIGTDEDDTFIGGAGSDQFNAMFSDSTSDTFDGGDGNDTLIIEDKLTNRGIFGDYFDNLSSNGVSVNSIDLDSIVITDSGAGIYNVTGTNERTIEQGQDVTPDFAKRDIDIDVTDVERIDIREYVEEAVATTGAEGTELYVVDSYELLEEGQGDLGDMYYVTSLGHTTFEIHDGEAPTYQTIDILGKTTNIYYSGHHTDFDRSDELNNWTAGGAAALYAADNNNEIWQGHESIFFAWYDPDAEGLDNAFEIAVKYDGNDKVWKIANKVFDTFSNIKLTQSDADTLNSLSDAIQEDSSLAFEKDNELRVYLGAAYQDITDVISSDDDVDEWDFTQTFSTSRSTYYIEIPNGTPETNEQVKVEYNSSENRWELRADETILVNIPPLKVALSDDINTPVDESASVVAGSDSAESISAGVGADTMLGGGGADTYEINSGDSDDGLAPDAFGVQGDIINEIGGDIASTLGDSLNFTNIESIDQISFARNKIRFEEDEATLTITANNLDDNNAVTSTDKVHVFDHFNTDLPFRQVEQLLLDEGWELGQIWNLVADGQGGANRDVLVGGSGDDTLVSGGGADVMRGGAGADTFKLGSSDVTLADIGKAHGDVTMIRDFATGEDFIDLSALGISLASEVSTQTVTAPPENGGTTHTYIVNGTHVLAELMMDSDDTFADGDLILV